MSDAIPREPLEGIAIIGMACRFPRARTIRQFWRNLCDGVEAVARFSDEDLLAAGVDAALLHDSNYVRAAAILDDVEHFDASFFGFSPREAEMMDPQHRLFLECCWEALEDAGCAPDRGPQRIGVFAGAGISSYLLFNIYPRRDLVALLGDLHAVIGNDKDFLATRVSYRLNLRGPSVTVQTACSTSLVAACLASQSLLTYQSDLALAGGVSIRIPHRQGYLYQEEGILSRDGHCRAFDGRASGTVPGSGAGVVVLKRLADAVADGDHIYAVIAGTAMNNDGSMKVGYTAPSLDAQADVIAEALAVAGVAPETVGYVEAHGTGTRLGDPIEIAALTKVFRTGAARTRSCALGSVKTNIGHLDAAAGVAGLIKAALAVHHGMVPPSLHFERPNPEIDFEHSPFYVNTRLSEWRPDAGPRRAGVSSFGIGGTNAHVVLEEPPSRPASGPARRWHVVPLSARSAAARDVLTSALADHLTQHPDLSLADVAHTLQVGRTAFSHRRAVVCRDRDDALAALRTGDGGRVLAAVCDGRERPVVLLFPGQGSQHVGMGRGLRESEPTFRQHLDRCADLLAPHLGLDLRAVLFPGDDATGEAARLLRETRVAQPALFAVEYALARLWMEWGVRPAAMIGHSIGEYVAAALAGVLGLEDALALVAARGQLMQDLPRGAMLAVPLAEHEVLALLGTGLSLAAVNGPAHCVVAGTEDAARDLEERLAARGVICRRVETSHAFHSQMMDPIVAPFTELVSRVTLRPPQVPFLSNLTGTWITDAEATDPTRWARHLRGTVRFSDGVREVASDPRRVFLEVGPGRALSALVRRHRDLGERVVVASLRHPHDQDGDADALATAVARLWVEGVDIDWTGVHAHARRLRVPLPTYPFERARHWVEPQRPAAAPGHETGADGRLYVPSWRRSVPPVRAPRDRATGPCLVFANARGPGARLVARLREAFADVIAIAPADRYTREGESTRTVIPDEPETYDALLADLRASDRIPTTVVHLWSMETERPDVSPAAFDDAQRVGFHSVLCLARALGRAVGHEATDLVVVSSGAQEVTGDESQSPGAATVLAPCRVIPQEYPAIRCRSVDVVPPAPESREEGRLVEQLVSEIVGHTDDTVVAYRGAHRWVRVFDPVPTAATEAETLHLRDRGHYVITGGLGRVGLGLARVLATRHRARLTLISRAGLPPREQWDRLLFGSADGGLRARIAAVRAFEEAGAEVLAARADVGDAAQISVALAAGVRRFGEIHGVIHAAGVTDDDAFTAVEDTGRREAERHFWAKVRGAFALEEALRGTTLDFCLTTSSLAPVLGGVGAAAYAAADLAVEAFVRHVRGTRRAPWTSVSWDTWATGDDRPGGGLRRKAADRWAITEEDAAQVFERLPGLTGFAQIVVAAGDLSDRLRQVTGPAAGRTERAAPSRREGTAPGETPRNEIETRVARIWEEVLGIHAIGIHDDFFELGGNSLVGVQIISRLRSEMELELPLRSFFEHRTVAGVAGVIAEQQREAEGAELERMARLLDEIEVLSPEAARRALAEGSRSDTA